MVITGKRCMKADKSKKEKKAIVKKWGEDHVYLMMMY